MSRNVTVIISNRNKLPHGIRDPICSPLVPRRIYVDKGLVQRWYRHIVRFFAREKAVSRLMSTSSCPVRNLIYLCSVYLVGAPALNLMGKMRLAIFTTWLPAIKPMRCLMLSSTDHTSLDRDRLSVSVLPCLNIFV